MFKYKGDTADADFSEFDNALSLIKKIRDGKISLTEAKDDQVILRPNLGEIRKVQKSIF